MDNIQKKRLEILVEEGCVGLNLREKLKYLDEVATYVANICPLSYSIKCVDCEVKCKIR